MIGKFDEGKGWEIVCDNCQDYVLGYVGQEEKPLDENYFGFICGNCSPLVIIEEEPLNQ